MKHIITTSFFPCIWIVFGSDFFSLTYFRSRNKMNLFLPSLFSIDRIIPWHAASFIPFYWRDGWVKNLVKKEMKWQVDWTPKIMFEYRGSNTMGYISHLESYNSDHLLSFLQRGDSMLLQYPWRLAKKTSEMEKDRDEGILK